MPNAIITMTISTIFDVDTGHAIRDSTPGEHAHYQRNWPAHHGQARGVTYGMRAYRRVYFGDVRQVAL